MPWYICCEYGSTKKLLQIVLSNLPLHPLAFCPPHSLPGLHWDCELISLSRLAPRFLSTSSFQGYILFPVLSLGSPWVANFWNLDRFLSEPSNIIHSMLWLWSLFAPCNTCTSWSPNSTDLYFSYLLLSTDKYKRHSREICYTCTRNTCTMQHVYTYDLLTLTVTYIKYW